MKATDKTGKMVAIKEVLENDDIVVVTTQGVVIRQPAKTIRIAGRNTQGVRLIRLESGDKIAAIAVVPSEEEKEEGVVKADISKLSPQIEVPEKEGDVQGSLFEKKGSSSARQPKASKRASKKAPEKKPKSGKK
jgi:DNA gyrase subunit A